MSNAAVIPQAAIDRPLRLRMRADLQVSEQWFSGRRLFVIKDPLTLVYSYLTEHEHFILAALDGGRSIGEIQRAFCQRFAPQQVASRQLQAFLAQLHRSGLVLGESAGQGEQLDRRRQVRHGFDLLRLAERCLAIRWRGINPEPLLKWLKPTCGWLFSRWGFALWALVVLWAATVLAKHSGEFFRQLPTIGNWLTGSNLLLLGLTLILVKSLHELGHALAARTFGCRCREIGVQLFFLMPCLYTDVSDAWLLPSKWPRIAISAAGMYVELLLASVAVLLWWQVEPGFASSLCQCVIVVASLGTIVLNGNPLMRYDGYYIVSDLLEVPNLEQRSRSQFVAWLARWCSGIEWHPPDELDHRPRPLLAAYAAAALVYRATVLVGVYFASRAMLRPLHAEPLSDALLAGAVAGLMVPLALTASQFVMDARRKNEFRPGRLLVTATIIAAAIAFACFVPLPQRVIAPAVIEPSTSTRIYATVPGRLLDALPAGAQVKAGDAVAHLDNLDRRRDLARLQGERQQQALRLLELETLRGEDPARGAAIPTARQALADLDAQIQELLELIDRLTLRAPQDGMILPPPQRHSEPTTRQLVSWNGTPIDSENVGALIETGTLICLVAKLAEFNAVALINQADAPLVQPGRNANVSIPQWPVGPVQAVVGQISQLDTDELPPHLAALNAIPQRKNVRGKANPVEPMYQVRIRLENPPAEITPGTLARAMIVATPQPIATRIVRWLNRTFRFRG